MRAWLRDWDLSVEEPDALAGPGGLVIDGRTRGDGRSEAPWGWQPGSAAELRSVVMWVAGSSAALTWALPRIARELGLEPRPAVVSALDGLLELAQAAPGETRRDLPLGGPDALAWVMAGPLRGRIPGGADGIVRRLRQVGQAAKLAEDLAGAGWSPEQVEAEVRDFEPALTPWPDFNLMVRSELRTRAGW